MKIKGRAALEQPLAFPSLLILVSLSLSTPEIISLLLQELTLYTLAKYC